MAYRIEESQCTGCSACEPECPNNAIYATGGLYAINPKKCTECIGYFDEPQCVSACPIDDTCVIDQSYTRYVAAQLGS